MSAAPNLDVDLGDLRRLVDSDGGCTWFTAVVPAASRVDDAARRFQVNWTNARRQLEQRWSDGLEAIDDEVRSLPHDGGEALVIVHRSDGPTLYEFLDEPVHEAVTAESVAPRLTTIIESRQRTIPHVIVETDRAGADVIAFDGGRVLAVDQVEGDTEYIHRGHPGGWSQRRFQQRAENTWERNADDVASSAAELARSIDAGIVFVAGETRARHLVVESLSAVHELDVVNVDAGDPDGIADAVVRSLSDRVATAVTALAEEVRSRLGTGTAASETDQVMRRLAEGRVDVLLVHDDGGDDLTTDDEIAGVPAGARVVDAAVVAALRSDARIVVVPNLAFMQGPLASLDRW